MKTPQRAEVVNPASMSVRRWPDRMHEFRGTSDDFLEMAASLKRLAAWLKRPGSEEAIAADPALEATIQRVEADTTRLVEIIRFATSSRTAPKYGMTEGEFWEIVMAQGWRCAICESLFEAGGLRMNVDHNHDTGDVRGILCQPCNVALGFFGDNPNRLTTAAAYLTERGHYGTDCAEGSA